MILEIVQKNYLLQSADEMTVLLRDLEQNAVGGDPNVLKLLADQKVEIADLHNALIRVQEAIAALASMEPDAAAVPQDAGAGQVQSVLQRYFVSHDLVHRSKGAGAGPVESPISDLSLSGSAATKAPKKLFGEMSQTDGGWIACLAAKAFRNFAKRRPFPDRPAEPATMADNARVYLVGDWGSGISRAKKIGERIRVMLDDEGKRDQHVIHLGDVYYSGWPEEYDDHFLRDWPVLPGAESKYGSWCLNGNHDMFSGGGGYFDYLLKDSRFKRQNGSSFFSLENRNWQILGLDSAWEDKDLAGSQFEWVENRHAANKEKKSILMTHHQPFSAFEKGADKLMRLIERNPVTAWFWGHEHRFAMYKPREDLQYARLLGHGGVPVWARSKSKKTPDTVEYVSNRGFRSGIEQFALFGFAVMDFDGPSIQVRYFEEFGEIEKNETLQCKKS
jgi:predicted phosphohydrolase